MFRKRLPIIEGLHTFALGCTSPSRKWTPFFIYVTLSHCQLLAHFHEFVIAFFVAVQIWYEYKSKIVLKQGLTFRRKTPSNIVVKRDFGIFGVVFFTVLSEPPQNQRLGYCYCPKGWLLALVLRCSPAMGLVVDQAERLPADTSSAKLPASLGSDSQ